MNATIFTSREEAIAREILPSLGVFADEHDLDKIFEAAFGWYDAPRPGGGTDLNKSGFVCVLDEDEYWAVVESARIKSGAQE